MNYRQKQNNSSNQLLRYAGLAFQIFASLGIAVFLGYHADRWLNITFPLLVWALPLIVVSMMIYKLIKETSNQKKKNADE